MVIPVLTKLMLVESEKMRSSTSAEKSRLNQRMKALEDLNDEKSGEIQRLRAQLDRKREDNVDFEHKKLVQKLESRIKMSEEESQMRKRSFQQLEVCGDGVGKQRRFTSSPQAEMRALQSNIDKEKQRQTVDIASALKRATLAEEQRKETVLTITELRGESDRLRKEYTEYKQKALKILEVG